MKLRLMRLCYSTGCKRWASEKLPFPYLCDEHLKWTMKWASRVLAEYRADDEAQEVSE